jgi:hypothetical protein
MSTSTPLSQLLSTDESMVKYLQKNGKANSSSKGEFAGVGNYKGGTITKETPVEDIFELSADETRTAFNKITGRSTTDDERAEAYYKLFSKNNSNELIASWFVTDVDLNATTDIPEGNITHQPMPLPAIKLILEKCGYKVGT